MHVNGSRVYNYQIAATEFVILISALLIYGKAFIKSVPIRSSQFLLFIGIITIYFASSLQSDFVRGGLIKTFSLAFWIAYFWLIVFLLKERYLKPETLILAVAVSTLLPIILITWNYFELRPIAYKTFIKKEHLELYSNIRHAGYHLLAAYFFSLFFIIRQAQKLHKGWLAFGCFLIVINLTYLLLTGGRQGILLVLAFTPIILFLYFRIHLWKITIALLVALLVISAIAYAMDFGGLLESIGSKFSNIKNLKTGGGRLAVWHHAIDLIAENPWFGIGPDTFIHIRKPRTRVIQTHNAFLQFTMEAGVIAGLMFISSVSLFIVKAKKMVFKPAPGIQAQQFSILMFCFVVVYLVNSCIDGIFYHVLPVYMFSMAAALLVYQFKETKELEPAS